MGKPTVWTAPLSAAAGLLTGVSQGRCEGPRMKGEMGMNVLFRVENSAKDTKNYHKYAKIQTESFNIFYNL